MINRRELFKRLGLAAGVTALAPLVEKLSSGMTITLADLHRDTNPLGSRVKIGPNAPMFTGNKLIPPDQMFKEAAALWDEKVYAEYKREFKRDG